MKACFLSACFPCMYRKHVEYQKIPFKVQCTVCIVCKLSSVSVPVSVPVPFSAHVCFRFWFQSNKSRSGSVPVPVDKSVPVDHYKQT